MSAFRKVALAAAALLAAALSVAPATAEVAALLDEDGNYLRTEVNQVQRGRNTSVWLSTDRFRGRDDRLQRVNLNESGAFRGDGMPSVASHPRSGMPWAVWSFNEDGDQELALSSFDGQDWSAPALLGKAGNGIADLEPQLLFTTAGQPLIVWWRMSDDGQEQSVWFTTRIDGSWRAPMQLSSSRVKAYRPTMLLRNDELIVAYDSEAGIRIRVYPLASSLVGASTAGGADGPDPPTHEDTRPPECHLIGCLGF